MSSRVRDMFHILFFIWDVMGMCPNKPKKGLVDHRERGGVSASYFLFFFFSAFFVSISCKQRA